MQRRTHTPILLLQRSISTKATICLTMARSGSVFFTYALQSKSAPTVLPLGIQPSHLIACDNVGHDRVDDDDGDNDDDGDDNDYDDDDHDDVDDDDDDADDDVDDDDDYDDDNDDGDDDDGDGGDGDGEVDDGDGDG
jgi:hypothetical protein